MEIIAFAAELCECLVVSHNDEGLFLGVDKSEGSDGYALKFASSRFPDGSSAQN